MRHQILLLTQLTLCMTLGVFSSQGRALLLEGTVTGFGAEVADSSTDASVRPVVDAIAVVDPTNFGEATANATAGTVGIASSITQEFAPFINATFDEQWNLTARGAGVSCLTTVRHPVTLIFHINGVLSRDWATTTQPSNYSFNADIGIGNDGISLHYNFGTTALTGQFCDFTGCSPVTIASTLLPDSSQSFDATFSFSDELPGTFNTSMVFAGGWDGPDSSSIGFIDTLGFNIVSNSDAGWTSDGGRSSIAGVPPTSVPEPATLSLLGLGLAGVGFARRRKAN